jgi:putative ATP-dependent endonuclease of OLD family
VHDRGAKGGTIVYLQSIHVRNYRCFDDEGVFVTFQPGLNVVIGENDTGKSALMDALRLGFSLGTGLRDIYVAERDFHLRVDGGYSEEIGLDFTFADLSEVEEAVFLEMLVLGPPVTAQLHLRYRRDVKEGISRIRPVIWGGQNEGQPVSFETLELMNHVFLGPLRDAERHLRPGRGSRLGQLLRKLVGSEQERRRIMDHVVAANRQILRDDKIQEAAEVINRHLQDIERARLSQNVRLGLTAPEFGRIADSLRILLPLSGTSPRAVFGAEDWEDFLTRHTQGAEILRERAEQSDGGVSIDMSRLSQSDQEAIGGAAYEELQESVLAMLELDQNCMGYNNLIYMGTVLGDLRERKNVEPYSYNCLLIEEPEAHLHPQLQDLVFDFFRRVSAVSAAEGAGAESIQVFLTSHSPTLTSRADIDSVIVLHKRDGARVSATALRHCPLEPSHKADLRRYLDVTKSQLLFAKGVILVEGISEALLLPVLAKRLGRRLDHNAVAVVNIGGTAFEPFALLFNSRESQERIGIPCVIISDDDRCSGRTDPYRLTEEDTAIRFSEIGDWTHQELDERLSLVCAKLAQGAESERARAARSFVGGALAVITVQKTLEYQLAREPTNVAPMLNALERVHPRVAAALRRLFADQLLDHEQQAVCLWLATSESKARFAQVLAGLLDEYDAGGSPVAEFKVPKCIEDAVMLVAPVATDSPRKSD